MREPVFIQRNLPKWTDYSKKIQQKNTRPDELAAIYMDVMDDLSYAHTHYPQRKTTLLLNQLAAQLHQHIYRNKKEKPLNRLIQFYGFELPLLLRREQALLGYALAFFVWGFALGWLSNTYDTSFVRMILGDYYVDLTLQNIQKGDPFGVYKSSDPFQMFFQITYNNIAVSFRAYIWGLFAGIGTVFILLYNGIMLGAFQQMFFEQGLLVDTFLTVWLHGTVEILSIVLGGASGLMLGRSLVFPGTYSRLASFRRGVQQSIRLIIALVPFFFLAGFIESFVTRHYQSMPVWLKATIVLGSLAGMVYYFVVFPWLAAAKTPQPTDEATTPA
ncbi:MAG TPA: hypothetical protein DCM08_02920 [Microscillaceae bacterium]|jgi:uncharacterized membrane protein SpoIIM required for sporulation|nr:hypothetical protein [Microscillaceae bacterium]